MKLEYGFLCEVGGGNKWREISLESNPIDGQPVRCWDHARYLLEYKMKMHVTCNKGSPVYSCLHGMLLTDFLNNNYRWNDLKILKGDYHLASDTRIVLKRLPIPKPLQRYVPDRFNQDFHVIDTHQDEQKTDQESNQEKDQEEIDEDALIASMMADTAAMFQIPQYQTSNRHPSEFEIGEHGAIPPPKYRCNGCGVVGNHFRKQCPRDLKGIKKALDRCHVPHGIPKTMLEAAEDGKSQLRTEDGLFVQRANQGGGKTLRKFFPGLYLDTTNVKPGKKRETWESFGTFLDAIDRVEKDEERAFYQKHPELRRKNNSLCQYYLRGLCQKSAWECQFLHKVDDKLMPICQFFVKDNCSAGDTCIFKHELPRPKPKPTCQSYKRGFCSLGSTCPRNHIKYSYPRSAQALGVEHWQYQLMTHVLNGSNKRPYKRQCR